MRTTEEALRILHDDCYNVAAWEIIAADVYKPLLAYVASLLITFRVAPGETAGDIVHEVLLSFYQRWPVAGVTTVSALHAYLRTSCRNLLIDRYRRERHAEQFVDFLALKFTGIFQDESDIYKSIFLNEIIQKMPHECGALFRRFVVEDLSPAEIADETGESPAKFYSRWYRCLSRAKEIFVKKKRPAARS